jgi:hypothetical protein
MAKAFVAVARLLSVTWIVKLAAVAAPGWPVIAPVEAFNKRGLGKDPVVTAQV